MLSWKTCCSHTHDALIPYWLRGVRRDPHVVGELTLAAGCYGNGDFGTPEFLDFCKAGQAWYAAQIQPDTVIAGVDAIILSPVAEYLSEVGARYDVLFQDEGNGSINPDVTYVIRNHEAVREALIGANTKFLRGDVLVASQSRLMMWELNERGVKWGLFDRWAVASASNSGFCGQSMIYHANCTEPIASRGSVALKCELLGRVAACL